MQQMLNIIPIIIILLSASLQGKTVNWNTLPLGKKVTESLNEEPYTHSRVSSKDDSTQALHFIGAGLHPKSCSFALIKLSRYEDYSKFLSFIKTSAYDEQKQRIILKLSHTLLPFDMGLNFVLPRIKGPGTYPFRFDRGFLKGLKGAIHVSKHKERCLFYSEAHWEGPDSGINNQVFGFFSQALGKIAFERLFRISQTLWAVLYS